MIQAPNLVLQHQILREEVERKLPSLAIESSLNENNNFFAVPVSEYEEFDIVMKPH